MEDVWDKQLCIIQAKNIAIFPLLMKETREFPLNGKEQPHHHDGSENASKPISYYKWLTKHI